VNLVHTLYRRFRLLIHEGAKFLVIGGVGFVVTEVAFNLFRFSAGLGLFTSNALATLIATVVTYFGNRYWTFRHREGKGTTREGVMFLVLNGVGLLIQYGCVWIAQNVLGFPHDDKFSTNVALLIGIALGTLFRFWSYRKWVWDKSSAGPAGPASGQEHPAGPGGPSGHEAREPALVPYEPAPQPGANGPGNGGNGNGNGRHDSAGPAARPDGPRHARSR
jgi:putative flippase GtrA